MTPATRPRKPRNSSKVNLIISLVFHGLIVVALVYFAAREGMLGKQLRKLAVSMVKEKPPEKPKEPETPKVEPPKVEEPKLTVAPKIAPPAQVAPPSGNAVAPPVTAPPAVDIPSFFDGGKVVNTDSDPVHIYQGQIESELRARWPRPEDMDDANFVAEVDLTVDPEGQLSNPVWKKGSGNKRWDDSVRQALAATKSLNTKPPANFPSHFTVRFDVQKTESIVP